MILSDEMNQTSKIFVALAATNMLLYTAQGARLWIEAGFTHLVLSNLLNVALFSAALALSLTNTRPNILATYTAAVAAYITYRMWGPVIDATRGVEFRLGHGLMIALAWLLVSLSLPRILRRDK
ncbi:hypothetical protein HRbin02_00071 [Candidatus Calditenuaceae archaeon HR02]|nr:hypothetical protein HRbin02_00071 [Candidatus Calditenuaceae archaeon HR02]